MPDSILNTVSKGAGVLFTVGIAGEVLKATKEAFKQPKQKKQTRKLKF